MTKAEMLAVVKTRHKAAGNKVSRLRNSGGVELAGTKHDVRRDLSKVKGYNRLQLQTYMKQLDAFTDRKNKYAGDAQGRVLNGETLSLYKEREKAYNHLVNKDYNKIKNTPLPFGNSTIDQRNREMLASRKGGINRTVNSKFNPPERKSKQFKSNRSLEVMSDAMAKRLDGGYKSKELDESRRIFNDMLAVIGDKATIERAAKLTDKQFDVMWNHTSMPDDVKLPYLIMKKALEENSDIDPADIKLSAMDQEDLDNNLRMAGKWIGWAEKLKLNG